MQKLIKVIISVLVVLAVFYSVTSYFHVEEKVKNTVLRKVSEERVRCSTFSMKTDAETKEKIATIVTTLADTSTFGLAFKSSHLKQLGKEIDKAVPSPLAFLAIIFIDPKLANDMKKVKQSSFKYNNFCEGLYKNMYKSYQDTECFKDHIGGFSKALGIDSDKTYVIAETCGKHGENGNKGAFRPFVDYLIKMKS